MQSPLEWNLRFTQQARWTEQVRRVLFDGLGLEKARRGLEVGCGTGVISEEIFRTGQAKIHGIDLRWDFLHFGQNAHPALHLAQANAFHLPFETSIFDFSFCHYFLLWAADPLMALYEMRRVTRAGGVVFALAEPDYDGRIDYPLELAAIGEKQGQALRRQGADPGIGRKLGHLFHSAGLIQVQTGVLGGQWGPTRPAEEIQSEWDMLSNDLAKMISPEELRTYQDQDAAAWQAGERILYVPTFYAWGYVPGLPVTNIGNESGEQPF